MCFFFRFSIGGQPEVLRVGSKVMMKGGSLSDAFVVTGLLMKGGQVDLHRIAGTSIESSRVPLKSVRVLEKVRADRPSPLVESFQARRGVLDSPLPLPCW